MAGEQTVLLVEDNEDSREIYGTVLRNQGYRVLVAEDGGTGLAAAREHRPDAVVVDLGLPGMDGVEVVRRLREDAVSARAAILVLTVHDQPGDRAGAEAAGCDRYVVKPADPAWVGEEVGRMLRERASPPPPAEPGAAAVPAPLPPREG